ncbi:MAG: DUF2059 domain-containing protein [Alphaproteobacteria bacterium]|nr:DUF2059 domain-containing protein [Alphaproteobacteria bacterium]
MKLMAFLALFVLFFAAPVHADAVAAQGSAAVDPKNYAIALQIVRSFDLKAQLHGVLDVVSKTMSMILNKENPGQSDKINAIVAGAVEKSVSSHLGDMEKNDATVYAQIFTYDELTQLRGFYQSPVGQKFIKATPQLISRNAALNRSIMLSAIQDANRAVIEQMHQDGMKIPQNMGGRL